MGSINFKIENGNKFTKLSDDHLSSSVFTGRFTMFFCLYNGPEHLHRFDILVRFSVPIQKPETLYNGANNRGIGSGSYVNGDESVSQPYLPFGQRPDWTRNQHTLMKQTTLEKMWMREQDNLTVESRFILLQSLKLKKNKTRNGFQKMEEYSDLANRLDLSIDPYKTTCKLMLFGWFRSLSSVVQSVYHRAQLDQ